MPDPSTGARAEGQSGILGLRAWMSGETGEAEKAIERSVLVSVS